MKSGIGKVLGGDGLFGPLMREDPYSVYGELRENDPVHWNETLQAWVLTRYDDVALALNDARFSSRRVTHARHRFADSRWDPMFQTLASKMSEQDEPDHKRQRALVHDAFIRTSVHRWQADIEQRVESLLDNARHPGKLEFVSEMAIPLPLMVILEIVGIPEGDRDQVKRWCDDFAVVALNYFAGITEEELQAGMQSTVAFREYLRELAASLKDSQKHDLLSSLVLVQHAGTQLSLDELLANSLLLLSAGNETTSCLLSNGLAALLQFPAQLELLRAEPERMPHAIEECLRYDSPVQFLGRIALADVEFQDATIRTGDLVLAVVASANRDPAKFERPDELNITRLHNPHFSFGHGPHFCVGAQLARLEAQVTWSALLHRYSKIELDRSFPLVHRENFNVRCYQKLPLKVAD